MLNGPKLRDFRVTISPTHKLCHVSDTKGEGDGNFGDGDRVYVPPMGCEITSENLAKSLPNDMGNPEVEGYPEGKIKTALQQRINRQTVYNKLSLMSVLSVWHTHTHSRIHPSTHTHTLALTPHTSDDMCDKHPISPRSKVVEMNLHTNLSTVCGKAGKVWENE